MQRKQCGGTGLRSEVAELKRAAPRQFERRGQMLGSVKSSGVASGVTQSGTEAESIVKEFRDLPRRHAAEKPTTS